MSEFLRYVLWELRNSFGLVFVAVVCGVLFLMCSRFFHRKKYGAEAKYPWGRILLWFLFACYCTIVAYATLLRFYGGYREVNFHLFRAWRESWNNFSVKNWANVLLNIAMFMPMGFLLPLLIRKFRKWYVTVPFGFLISLIIELVQLAFIRGICDVDDLFCNGLGCMVGYFTVMFLISACNEKGKRFKSAFVYGFLALICVGSIGSVFIVYHVREYGNLPDAASYRIDTGNVKWSLDCDLPEVGRAVAVYQTQTRSRAECDAFAEEFRKIISTEYNTVSYYQEAAYYMDNGSEGGAHFLHVNYLDQGYDYSAIFDDEPVWADLDRETVENALGKFPLYIPEMAEFSMSGDGWYSFTAKQLVDGDMLVDGLLRVRIAADGTVREIENGLLRFDHYGEVEIISPEVAYERMRAGKFLDTDFFEMKNPDQISVLSCELEYRVDTKGFYQPVYVFEVVSADGDYQNRVVIPAMK